MLSNKIKDVNTFQLIELIFKIARLMKGEMSFKNALLNLSALQIQTLILLHRNKEATMSEIAEYFHTELPSATILINKLFKQRLVWRYSDREDRRIVRVALTRGGKQGLKQITDQRRKKLEKILSYLSEKDKANFLAILETLHSHLQNQNEK